MSVKTAHNVVSPRHFCGFQEVNATECICGIFGIKDLSSRTHVYSNFYTYGGFLGLGVTPHHPSKKQLTMATYGDDWGS
jgi:hypothetical protein